MSVHAGRILWAPNRYKRVLVARLLDSAIGLPRALLVRYDLVITVHPDHRYAYVVRDDYDWTPGFTPYPITVADAVRISRAGNAETVTVEFRAAKVVDHDLTDFSPIPGLDLPDAS